MRLLIFSCLLIFSANSMAYELKQQYRNYGVNDGLPSSQVYEIIEDSKGYIWFGTDRGLVRYNGYEFKTYTVQDGLSVDVIFHLDEGPDGTIYCYGKDKRIHLLKNDNFSEFKYNDSLMHYHTNNANLLNFDFSSNGFVFNSVDIPGMSLSHASLSQNGVFKKSSKLGFQILDDNSGLSIFGKYNGQIDGLSINGKRIETQHTQDTVGLYSNVVKYQEVLYFSIGHCLYKYDPHYPNKVDLINKFKNEILDLAIDTQGNLYLGLRFYGLLKLTKGDYSIVECMIENANISSILIDNNNGIWAASLFRGLFYFDDQKNLVAELNKGKEIGELKIVGTEIYGFTRSMEFFKLNKSGDNYIELDLMNDLDFELSSTSIIMFNNGYSGIQKKVKSVVNIADKKYFPQLGRVEILIEDSIMYEISTHKVNWYNRALKSHDFCTSDIFVNCAIWYDQDKLLFGADEGVYTVQIEHDKLDTVYEERGLNKRKHPISFDDFMPENTFFRSKVRDMLNIGDTMLLFASAENGLFIQQATKDDLCLTMAEGLISNAIDQVYFIENYIIAISKKGLSIINEENGIVNYTRRNGLLSNEINDVIIRNDSLWTVTNNGTSVFSLKRRPTLKMPINLTACVVNGIDQPVQNKYQLKHQDRTFEVSFEALSYIQEGKINYKYQLNGLDNDWISTQNRTARYSNLPAGEFSFWLMAENADNSWTQPICLFEISKPKPFWLTIYFIGAVVFLFIGLTGLLFRWRYRRIQRKERAKLQVLNLERKTLQAQMNPHFIFNSLTSLQNLIIKNDPDLANEYLGKFARLTRIALLQSTQNWVKLKDEVTLLEHYIELEQIRFPDHFKYQITIKLEDPIIFVPPFLIQPFVENAILHGLAKKQDSGKIEIVVESSNDHMIQFTIVDNGLGRGEAKNATKRRHQSLGIRLIKERLQLLLKINAVEIIDLFDDKINAIGTKVVVYVPYKKNIDESVNN